MLKYTGGNLNRSDLEISQWIYWCFPLHQHHLLGMSARRVNHSISLPHGAEKDTEKREAWVIIALLPFHASNVEVWQLWFPWFCVCVCLETVLICMVHCQTWKNNAWMYRANIAGVSDYSLLEGIEMVATQDMQTFGRVVKYK